MDEPLKLVYEGRLPGINELVGANRNSPYGGAKMKRKYQKRLVAAWWEAGKFPFPNHVTVRVRFYERDQRRDDDNVFGGLKFVMDALQEIGVIVNDSPKYCHVLPERFVDKKEPRIEVEIREDK